LFSLSSTAHSCSIRAASERLHVSPSVISAVASTEVFRERMVAAFAPNHPLAKRKVVSARELAEYPLVLTEPSFGLRQQVDRTLARHGIKPEIFCVTNSLALVKGVAGIGPAMHATAPICGSGRNRRGHTRHECGEGVRARPSDILRLCAQRPDLVAGRQGLRGGSRRLLPPLPTIAAS
jgi:DNA-binding transcriptional LysR family regulator